jgi:hypothetical protein
MTSAKRFASHKKNKMVCLLQTEAPLLGIVAAPGSAAIAAAPPNDRPSGDCQRLDPAAPTSEAPELRERLLRLIVEREAKRKLQRSG